MKDFNEYIDVLINACKSSIEQMTRIKVNSSETRTVLKEQNPLPFAHIISYTDHDKEIDGEFILGFESIRDALKLASGIAERLGLEKFDKISEDSTDLLNEFLNIVVGRTISEWDSMGLRVDFNAPVFKENYLPKGSRKIKGYLISLEINSGRVDLEKTTSSDQILLRVNFIEKIENKIENKILLLAEDSKVMRGIIAKTLKEYGAKIHEAKDGVEAVKLHRMYDPDLTLMDINMPNLNGLEAIEQIKKFHPKSKFIILSSSSRKDEIIKAKTLSVSGYLVKPVDKDQLIERVSSIF